MRIPSTPALVSAKITTDDPTIYSRSMTGRTYTRKLAGQNWKLNLKFAPCTVADSLELQSVLNSAQGRMQTLEFDLPEARPGNLSWYSGRWLRFGTGTKVYQLINASRRLRDSTTDPYAAGDFYTGAHAVGAALAGDAGATLQPSHTDNINPAQASGFTNNGTDTIVTSTQVQMPTVTSTFSLPNFGVVDGAAANTAMLSFVMTVFELPAVATEIVRIGTSTAIFIETNGRIRVNETSDNWSTLSPSAITPGTPMRVTFAGAVDRTGRFALSTGESGFLSTGFNASVANPFSMSAATERVQFNGLPTGLAVSDILLATWTSSDDGDRIAEYVEAVRGDIPLRNDDFTAAGGLFTAAVPDAQQGVPQGFDIYPTLQDADGAISSSGVVTGTFRLDSDGYSVNTDGRVVRMAVALEEAL